MCGSFTLLSLEGLQGFKADSSRLHPLIREYMGYLRLKGYKDDQGLQKNKEGYKGLQEVTRE